MYASFSAGHVNPSAEVTVTDSLLLSLVGFSIVFAVLVVLILVVKLIRLVLKKEQVEAAASKPAKDSSGSVALTSKVPAPGSMGEINLYSVEDKTAAMLMAIVADEMNVPLNELRFISITELEETK